MLHILFSVFLVVCVLIVLQMFFRVINQYKRAVVFRLGKYVATKGPGLIFVIPFVDRVQQVDLRVETTVVDAVEQITSDNVPIKVSAVIWHRITDPEQAIVKVNDVRSAVVQVALTTLRNVIGQHRLDDVLKNRDKLADLIKVSVDAATHGWGMSVDMIELKQTEIPQDMQRAMAQEAEALREKLAREIKADGEKIAAQKLSEAAEIISKNPNALELRRMQMITEVGAEQNTSTIILMPSEFVSAAGALAKKLVG